MYGLLIWEELLTILGRGCQPLNLQQEGLLRKYFLFRREVSQRSKNLTDKRTDTLMVVLLILNQCAILLCGNLCKDGLKFWLASFQVGHLQHSKTLFGYLAEPPSERCAYLIFVFLLD